MPKLEQLLDKVLNNELTSKEMLKYLEEVKNKDPLLDSIDRFLLALSKATNSN